MNESPLSGRLARAVILLLMPLALLRGQTGFDATVSGTTTEVVPIALSGFSGDARKVLEFDLYVAGFELVAPDKARFTLTGKAGAAVEGTLTDATRRTVFARAYPGGTVRAQAHALADDVIQSVTGVKGVCRTKIAYRVESGQRNANRELVSEIVVADYDGANAVQLTRDGTVARSPAWIPGRRVLLYTSYLNNRPCVYSHDLTTGNRAPFASFGGLNDGATVSPDGSQVALILSRSGSPDLWVMDASGGNPRRLTTTREEESSPCWSPDGRRVCFSSSAGGALSLYTIPVAGGAMQSLNTGGIRGTTEPDWSPDGKWIAFTRMGRGQNFEVYVMPAGGGAARKVVDGEDPTWAPNSRTLVVARRAKDGQRRLSLLDVPTGHVKDALSVPGSCSQPSWAR